MYDNSTFYPTPRSVIRQMLDPVDWDNVQYALDPECGDAAILEYMQERYSSRNRHELNLYGIELDPDLVAVTESKGFPIIGRNFLETVPNVHFDLIAMNPPFDHGACLTHLCHAWNILHAGQIVCLLPQSALDGKNRYESAALKLIGDHGKVELIGPAFKTALRPTDEPMAIVRLTKVAPEDQGGFTFHVENDEYAEPQFADVESALMPNNFIGQLVQFYKLAIENFPEYHRARNKVDGFSRAFGTVSYQGKSMSALDIADNIKDPQRSYNAFVRYLNDAAWAKILDHKQFQAVLTKRARDQMDEFRRRQKWVDFNEKNVRAMFLDLVARSDELFDGAVLDAFETMSAYDPSNRIHFEGWKSNDCWRINKRVVLPYFITYEPRWGGSFSLNYRMTTELNDLDRALCVVSQRPFVYGDGTIQSALEIGFEHFRKGSADWNEVESYFFRIRFYKKGTIHLWWKDEELLERFNFYAAKARKWLPPSETSPAPKPSKPSRPGRATRNRQPAGDASLVDALVTQGLMVI